MDKPPIGTKMYYVREHRYYNRAVRAVGPLFEYAVCEGEIKSYFDGSYVEMCVKGKDPDGYNDLCYARLNDIGKKVFFTLEEAIGLAERMTRDYEEKWSWFGPPDIPLRRPWRGGDQGA